MAKHNKKRNTGLLYEWLARCIANAIVEKDEEKRLKSFNIVKEHFKKGTELYKEFRLFNALVSTTVSSESVANSILTEAKSAARNYDKKKLDYEKSLLIRSINHELNDPNFYNQIVEDYTDYATVQTLLNEWRNGEGSDLAVLAKYEDKLKKKLMAEKKRENIREHIDTTSDALVVKLMTKKINERYGTLNEESQDLIRSYVFEENHEKVKKHIKSLKDSILEGLDRYLLSEGTDKYLVKKLSQVKEKIMEVNTDIVNDEVVDRFLDISKLREEIECR